MQKLDFKYVKIYLINLANTISGVIEGGLCLWAYAGHDFLLGFIYLCQKYIYLYRIIC